MQRRRLCKGEGKITISAVKLSGFCLWCVCFFLSFSEPGANNKLLLCAISEPWLNYRCINYHFRCVLFMFLVYMLTLISFFFLPCYGVEVNTAEDIQVQPPHSLGSFQWAVGSFHPTLPFEYTESLLFWGTAHLFYLSIGGYQSYTQTIECSPNDFLWWGLWDWVGIGREGKYLERGG